MKVKIEKNERGTYDIWAGQDNGYPTDDYLHGANASKLYELTKKDLEDLKRAIKKVLKLV